jgi:hypothetical protein
MARALLILLPLALTLYTFIDCAMRDETLLKKIPKWGWLLVILFLQPLGGIAYLIIGRNRVPKVPKPGKKRILPPDDDPDFLRSI